jgi:hypothetical protein
MNYLFAIPFGLVGAFCAISIIQELAGWGWPPWLSVLAGSAVMGLLFLAARRLFKLGSMSESIIRSRKVSCWLSLVAPFAAWTFCHCCEFWPWGMPVTKIYLAWHLGFLGSGVQVLLAIVQVLARREYKWVWMPIAGLGLTIPFAASTHHMIYIW